MNPFKTFIAAMRQRVTDMLAGLPPDAQVDAATAPGVAVRACRRIGTDMDTALTEANNRVDAEIKRIEEDTRATVRAELVKDAVFLKASGLITQADHDTAVTAAVNAQKETVKGEIEKGVGLIRQAAERRRQLITDKVLSPVAAGALADEVLTAPDYMTGVNKIKGRLEKLATIKGLAEDSDTIKRIATMPITAEGDTAFTDSFGIWEKAAKSGGGGPAAPLKPPGGDAKSPVVLF